MVNKKQFSFDSGTFTSTGAGNAAEFCRAPFSYFRVCLVRVGFERLIFVGV